MLNIQRNIDPSFLYVLYNWAFQSKKLKISLPTFNLYISQPAWEMGIYYTDLAWSCDGDRRVMQWPPCQAVVLVELEHLCFTPILGNIAQLL